MSLPTTYTAAELRRQVDHFYQRVAELEAALDEHKQNVGAELPP